MTHKQMGINKQYLPLPLLLSLLQPQILKKTEHLLSRECFFKKNVGRRHAKFLEDLFIAVASGSLGDSVGSFVGDFTSAVVKLLMDWLSGLLPALLIS